MEKLTKAQARIVQKSPDAARLMAAISFADSGCWEIVRRTPSNPYGSMMFRGKVWKPHRVSFTLFCGEIPAGLFVCHHCDNPPCVNPDHLFLGTAVTNMRDMVRKGRGAATITSLQDHFKAGKAPDCDQASGARLSREQAIVALDRAATGELTSNIASSMGVDRTTIQRLLRGATWKPLPRPAGLPRPTGAYSRTAGRAALAKEQSE